MDKGEDASNTVFCFDQTTYIIKLKDNACSVQPVLNGTITPKFFADYGQKEKYFIVELVCKGAQSTTHKITQTELNTAYKFMLWLRQHQGLFTKTPGYTRNIDALTEYIQAQPYVVTRKVEKIGLDSDSNCYVFPGFLYDEKGTRHQSQKHGVFDTFSIAIPDTPNGCHIVLEVDDNAIPEQIIKDFHQCFGNAGIFQLGAYIASIFANECPVIECTGSSAHVYINRMFFLDFDGVQLLQRGSSNQIAKIADCFSQWPVLFEEGHQPVKLNEPSLLSNRTNQTGLLFHRTFGEFATQEMLACSVSIECTQYKSMHDYRPSQLAAVGHAVMTNRKYFEDGIIDKTQEIQKRLISDDVKEDVALSHAVILASAALLIEQLNLDFINNSELYDYTLQLAQSRTELLSNRHPLADKFFDTLLRKIDIPDFNQMEKNKAELAAFSEGAAIMGDKLLFTMPLILENGPFKQIFSQGYTNRPPQLFNQLQLHPGYIMRDHRLRVARPSIGECKHQLRYWVFDLGLVRPTPINSDKETVT